MLDKQTKGWKNSKTYLDVFLLLYFFRCNLYKKVLHIIAHIQFFFPFTKQVPTLKVSSSGHVFVFLLKPMCQHVPPSIVFVNWLSTLSAPPWIRRQLWDSRSSDDPGRWQPYHQDQSRSDLEVAFIRTIVQPQASHLELLRDHCSGRLTPCCGDGALQVILLSFHPLVRFGCAKFQHNLK